MNNIDEILVELRKLIKKVERVVKFDGISIECFISDAQSYDSGVAEIEKCCKKLNLPSHSIEKSKLDDDAFLLQFPDLSPVYTDDVIEKFYRDNFKWLLDNITTNTGNKMPSKDIILRDADKFVKMAITTYYRSNTNQYKDSINNYLSNEEYCKKLNCLFVEILQAY